MSASIQLLESPNEITGPYVIGCQDAWSHVSTWQSRVCANDRLAASTIVLRGVIKVLEPLFSVFTSSVYYCWIIIIVYRSKLQDHNYSSSKICLVFDQLRLSAMSIAPFELPSVPAPHKDFIPHLSKRPNEPVANILSPYRIFERKLREGFAQHPQHDALKDPHINAIPVFNGHEGQLRIRARSLDDETENGKYIMPLSLEDRKPHGAHACVESLKDFRQNFNLFSESSLVDLDWSNVVAAGSSVVTSLLPVPGKYNTSKRALRYGTLHLYPSLNQCNVRFLADADGCLESTIIRSWLLPVTSTFSFGALTKRLRRKRSRRLRRTYAIPSCRKQRHDPCSLPKSSWLMYCY